MEFIYAVFENYGLWVLLLVVFFAQLGVPLGSTFFLMWYGSSIDNTFSLFITIPATACAAIAGDITAYQLGKRFSKQLDNAEKRYKWLAKKIQQSQTLLDSYGKWIIWLSRFLVTGLGPFVNYLLGSRQYPIKQFFLWISFGEIIFSAELLYFGYYFKDTWEDLLALLSDAGWLIALIILLVWLVKKIVKSSHKLKS